MWGTGEGWMGGILSNHNMPKALLHMSHPIFILWVMSSPISSSLLIILTNNKAQIMELVTLRDYQVIDFYNLNFRTSVTEVTPTIFPDEIVSDYIFSTLPTHRS